MLATKIFEATMQEFEAVVVDIREEQRVAGRVQWQLQLDQTAFAAGDRGELRATARSGAVLVVPVLAVVAQGVGEVWHRVEKPLAAGTHVFGRVEMAADECPSKKRDGPGIMAD